MKIFNAILLTCLMIGFSVIPQTTSAQKTDKAEPDQYVQVRVIANQTQVNGGETIRIGLEQTIYPSWHTYWLNPGDSGTPTSIEWELPPGFSVSDLEWPTPQKIPFGPLTNYGYEGQAILLQNLHLPEGFGNTPFALNGTVNLLVCHDICIPESHDVFITLNTGTMPEVEKIALAESKLPLTPNWESKFYADQDHLIIDVVAEQPLPVNENSKFFIAPEDWGAIDNTKDATFIKTQNGFQIQQAIGGRDLNEIKNLPIILVYENENGQTQSVRFNAVYEQPILPATDIQITKSDITILSALLFAFLGGIILNLMPCVFPVLSMKALSLINIGDKEEAKARGYGLSYTAGILITFGIIGVILLALKAGGAQIGWGFQLQNPIVIMALAYLIFVIGLNLSGFFEFTARLGKLGAITEKLSHKNDHRGAFFTGVLATLVATPCTAPFMGAALGFALTQPAYVSIIVFLMLGFGLALPYLALCFIPALRSKLPKPGAWMLTFKQFLSFPMFLTTIWLIWVLGKQTGVSGVAIALIGIIAISFSIWLVKIFPKTIFAKAITLILITLSTLIVLGTFASVSTVSNIAFNTETSQKQNWSDYTPQKLDDLLKGDSPIFTNMTADWCITCKVNEKIALSTETIRNVFTNYNIEYLKGDWTNQNSEITQYLNKYNRQGVPLYVYYGPRDQQTGKRPEPVILPQILTAGLVKKTITGE